LKLPSFVCVGPGRTGTTWLHAALTGSAGLPRHVKETRFWGQYYHKGLEWYADHFRHCDPTRPIGEACPYFATDQARERIARHLPNCKIIITLRDPVERSYSQYRMLRRMGLARGSFEQELNHPRIAETNRYTFHLQGWFDLFGSDNVQVLLFDELQSEPQNFLDRVCDFIELPRISLDTVEIGASDVNSYKKMPRSRRLSRRVGRLMDWMHERRVYRALTLFERSGLEEFCLAGPRNFPPLSADTEMRLREQLIPELENVEKFTGFDLSPWKQPSRINEETASVPARVLTVPGRRELAALLLALIPLATGAVPDGLDLGTMRFNSAQIVAALEDGSDDQTDEGALIAALA
jgi:hypothetical protein